MNCFRNITPRLLSFIIAVTICFAAVPAFAENVDTDFTFKVSDPVELPQYMNMDGEASYIIEDGEIWMLYSEFRNNNVNHKRFKGTSLDDLKEQEDGHFDSSFVKVHGDDKYWLCGLWADHDTGIWYALIHDEYNYVDPSHVRNIQLAESKDKGITWTLKEIVLTSDDPETKDYNPGRYMSFGVGDQKLFVDEKGGYFYLYYMNAWIDTVDGTAFANNYKTVSVARAPISGKMARGTWQKWYNGEWSQPGIGGHDSPLFTPPSTAAFVTYNTYLNRYIAFGMKKNSSDGFISTCTDMNLQNWTQPVKFIDAADMQWYQWVIDPTTLSRHVTGQTFRLYGGSAETKTPTYRTITLGEGTQKAEGFNSDYSYFTAPVFDYNAPYDPIPSEAHREDFINGLDGWQKKSGTAEWKVEEDGTMLSGKGEGIIIDEKAPELSDGHFVFSAAAIEGKKFGAVFRYASDNSYVAIRYDNGDFTYQTADGKSGKLFTKKLREHRAYRFDIDFTGKVLTVKINGEQMFSEEIPELPTEAGKAGFEIFGGATALYDNLAYYDGVIVEIDSLATSFDVQPIIVDDRTLVPMRRIFELFGAKVDWNESTQTVTAKKNDLELSLTIGSDKVTKNNDEITLDVPAKEINGRTLVPLRFVSEALGATVNWNEKTQTVEINSNGNLVPKRRVASPEPEEIVDDYAEGTLIDRMENFTKVYQKSGSWSVKKDDRPALGVAYRANRTSKETGTLVYKIDTGINSIKVKAFHGGTDGLKQYNFYVSDDGESWEKIKFKQENSIEDTEKTPGMYFSDMEPEDTLPEGTKYFKIEAPQVTNQWSNQIARVEINNPKSN